MVFVNADTLGRIADILSEVLDLPQRPDHPGLPRRAHRGDDHVAAVGPHRRVRPHRPQPHTGRASRDRRNAFMKVTVQVVIGPEDGTTPTTPRSASSSATSSPRRPRACTWRRPTGSWPRSSSTCSPPRPARRSRPPPTVRAAGEHEPARTTARSCCAPCSAPCGCPARATRPVRRPAGDGQPAGPAAARAHRSGTAVLGGQIRRAHLLRRRGHAAVGDVPARPGAGHHRDPPTHPAACPTPGRRTRRRAFQLHRHLPTRLGRP
ncbi:hypothetical protein EV192_10758 [Actinocrispum wychmicini]|uniref:Uncharacterized protein n=1 Tax=Actinocrispum wychmicini TaxID=1213861 RepID=A0A4R2JB95_9PSEU|nr:hypothetical protein EV192_10758 [Actinocrispum wychmicini]